MQIFAKLFWGFDPVDWPVVAFGKVGNRDSLLRKAQKGDRIIFIGTQGTETAENERGIILGMAEFGHRPLESAHILAEDILKNPEYHNNNGAFKWPSALPMLRAWRFTDTVIAKSFLGKRFNIGDATGAFLLDEEQSHNILNLNIEETPVTHPVLLAELQMQDTLKPSFGRTRGISPSSYEATITRNLGNEGFLYVMRFGQRNIWKVGCSENIERRCAEFNQHVPVEVLNEAWKPAYKHPFQDLQKAYLYEQALLDKLGQFPIKGERVMCTEKELESAWIANLASPLHYAKAS
jgi:hypothetical protein